MSYRMIRPATPAFTPEFGMCASHSPAEGPFVTRDGMP